MADRYQEILGIRFFLGDMAALLRRAFRGGLIVVPSAPVLAELPRDDAHREALQGSDFAIADSSFFVVLWLLRTGQRLPRISGLKFLRALVHDPEFRRPGAVFWIMPSAPDAEANRAWLARQGLDVTAEDCYLAPLYRAGPLEDGALLALLEVRRPAVVMINLGGGVQERLGWHLRQSLSYQPAIICTGAAIAFLSGQQANIPVWADRLMLGALLRSLNEPRKFVPRYVRALRLVPLVLRAGAARHRRAPAG